MSYDTPDVYYQPEKFELTPIAEIDFSDGEYCFDIRAVWKHKDGTLYTGRDSGCSCPGIFEDAVSLANLEKLDFASLEAEAKSELASEYCHVTKAQVDTFLERVAKAL